MKIVFPYQLTETNNSSADGGKKKKTLFRRVSLNNLKVEFEHANKHPSGFDFACVFSGFLPQSKDMLGNSGTLNRP